MSLSNQFPIASFIAGVAMPGGGGLTNATKVTIGVDNPLVAGYRDCFFVVFFLWILF